MASGYQPYKFLLLLSVFYFTGLGIRANENSAALPGYLPSAIIEKARNSSRHQISYTGRRSGVIKFFDRFGRQILEAGFKKNKLHGQWVSPEEKGYFEKGLPTGQWMYFNENGNLIALRQYNAGKLVAIGKEVRQPNSKHQQHHITRMVINQRTSLSSVLMAHNEMEGLQPPFTLALHDGKFINYYNNGLVKDSCAYSGGLRSGLFISYYATGQTRVHGYYKNGEQHGGWTTYSTAGKIEELTTYHHGKLVHRKRYDVIMP